MGWLDDRDEVLAALKAQGAELTKLAAVIRGDGTPDQTLRARLDAVDEHVGEARRNIRRVGTAVKADGIEGKA